jgi:hypothetical protein
MPTLVESTVRVTTTHNDNALIASAVATARISGNEETGARLLKPVAPCDPNMAKILTKLRANHPTATKVARRGGRIAAMAAYKVAGLPQGLTHLNDWQKFPALPVDHQCLRCTDRHKAKS